MTEKLEDMKVSDSMLADAKAEIGALSEDVEETPDESGNFSVSREEISIIRAELASEFPDEYLYFSDSYIESVASKPYSKDMSKRRPLDYSIKKLKEVLTWREETGVNKFTEAVDLAFGSPDDPKALENPNLLDQGQKMAICLNYGCYYLHGLTKTGLPVLWIRTNRLPWYPDVDSLANCLILMTDTAISRLAKGKNEYIVIADTTSPPPPHPGFLVKLVSSLVKGYPDRLGSVISAPTSSIMQFVMNLVIPLMPSRLQNKFFFIGSEEQKAKIAEFLLNGEDDIPTFMGGPADHDKFYPEESYCPNRGEGSLKFDFYGMCERLEQSVKEYEESHS
eukprot:CAMPEP_0178969426 /NCGR_PEP_ID=MMETSP0789-20121207/18855_1 /TAXON_ID=3005 /ORGANISM="Rhizosolenia setigera, Strain CCMP 1694" /LENGTH=335 /DNA_ID=CAMNT_0020655569 /DNA_START=46 /DNA_END=1053 /DNA_ORIENTATION=+